MTSIQEIIDGLSVFAAHGDDEMPSVCARHDVISARSMKRLSVEEGERLRSLGWSYNVDDNAWQVFT
jgi:hypothetical protein